MKRHISTEIAIANRLLNDVYEFADGLEAVLKRKSLEYERGNYTGHYIKLGRQYSLQRFSIPVFTIRNHGDMGVNLDGVFFEFVCNKDLPTLKRIPNIITGFPRVEIYGFKDCLNSFYKKGDSAKDVLRKLKGSKGKWVQFGHQFPLDTPPVVLLESFLRASTLLTS